LCSIETDDLANVTGEGMIKLTHCEAEAKNTNNKIEHKPHDARPLMGHSGGSSAKRRAILEFVEACR
jgi:hypothetical protein